MPYLAIDLSLLRRLAIHLDCFPTSHYVVQCRRLGFDLALGTV